jgi:hypothetical protein
MNRKGSCWGNAPTESLFATINSMRLATPSSSSSTKLAIHCSAKSDGTARVAYTRPFQCEPLPASRLNPELPPTLPDTTAVLFGSAATVQSVACPDRFSRIGNVVFGLYDSRSDFGGRCAKFLVHRMGKSRSLAAT